MGAGRQPGLIHAARGGLRSRAQDDRPRGARDALPPEGAGAAVRPAQLQVPGQGVKVQGGR